MTKVLTSRMHLKDSHKLKVYEKHGGYQALKKALDMQPAEIIEAVKQSGLRGRGGAGFPTGMKWSFLGKEEPRYLCVNADESEPGTFKDRLILEKDPHMMLEGIAIACIANGIQTAYIFIRGEFALQARLLEAAIREAEAKHYLGKNVMDSGLTVNVYVHRGAGAYICGEETGLIEALEGKKGQPRLKPPFPAVQGAFGKPTIVNNVESLAAVTWIIQNGWEAYAALGTEKSKGTRLMCVSGHIAKPGVYEVEMGMPMRQFIDEVAGGVRNGRQLKAVIPGGSSCPILTPEEVDKCLIDYESIAAVGSMAGSGGMIVIDESQCMVAFLEVLLHFYQHESCGQCTPCREGCDWLYQTVKRIEAGRGTEADIDRLLDIADNMEGRTICALAAAATMPTRSFLKKFRGEFVAHLTQRGCPNKRAPVTVS